MLDLIVVAPQPIPFAGSEPGKGFFWTVALSSFYRVHLVCLESAVPALQACDLCEKWVFHPLSMPPPMRPGLAFYGWYRKWCTAVIPHIREMCRSIRPVGLHHIILGSFRVLPAYHQLGIPYTLGPLGGGEFIPRRFIASTRLPMKQKVIESFRPLINTACVKNPFVVPVLRNAAASIATTEQTAQLLRAAGAKNVHTVFPDVTQDQREFDEVVSHRQLQSETIQQRCELVFSGRALWWKGCDVALLVLKKLVQKGCSVRFTVVSGGGDAVAGWKKCAAQLQLEPYVTWLDFMPKKDLLSLYENSHAFLYPTMHDSSSSAIPEAYSTGLPSVTLGIGGAGTASTSQTGFNEFHDTAELWATKAAERIREWTQTPSTWLAASLAARKHADSFSISGIKTFLSDYREWK